MIQIYERQRVGVWSLAACCLPDYCWLLSSLARSPLGWREIVKRMNVLFAKAIFGVFVRHSHSVRCFFPLSLFAIYAWKLLLFL